MTETSTPYHSISSSPSKQITVLDVYDLAASINRDFEKLAEQNGKDSIQDLVGKVISALETLEALAKHNDSTNGEILDLQQAVSRLEQEKNLRQKSKANLERDVAELEENYRREIDELWAMVKSLQEENKNIKSRMRDDREEESPQEKNFLVKEEEFQRMVDLRKMSNHQKEQIKDLQKDVEHYCCEVENLQNSIEKLIRQNKELLRKNGSLQKQGRLLVQERAELLRRIQESEEDNIQLRRILAETSRACKDLETQQQQDRESDSSPRFTLSELREVLQEKNGLKAKVMELEEQLEGCRGMSSSNSESGDRRDHFDNFSRPSSSSSFATQESAQIAQLPSEETRAEECVVYGPINREPEEKLYPWKFRVERKDSHVRRFFRFFKDLNASGISPRRGSNVSNSPKS